MAGRFSVEAVFKAVDRVTAPVSKMQNRVQKFTRNMSRGLHKANRALNKVIGGLKRGASVALKFGGVAVAAGITATAVAINKVANAADELAKRTRRLKFPIEEFQEWQFVAEQSGISTAEFDKSIEKFTKGVGEARAGTGTLVTILKKSNPELLKQITSASNAAEAYELYMQGLRNTENQLDKTALATAGFGRTGAKFLNITEQSTEAIKALRKEQKENGVITAQQAKFAEDYNDATNSLQKSLGGLLQNVLLPMLPKITKLVRTFREWIIANKDLIRANVAKLFEDIKTAIFKVVDSMRQMNRETSIFDNIKEVIIGMVRVFGFLAEHGKTIAIIIGGIVALSLTLKAFTIIMAAVNLVMSLNPFGLILLAIAAFIGVVALIIENWEPIKDFFSNLWDDVVGIFDSALAKIMGIVDKVKGAVSFVTGAVSNAASSALDFIGLGDDEGGTGPAGPQVVTPQERVARTIEEQRKTSTAEVTIRDETGRAEVTGGSLGTGLQLQSSGGF